ncbi:hypothetical protein L1987_19317 [Smallanthus sonchifolius]|uniref:Uncharacterized protein n=1 Tax=Smallanthus sonchifolius TaxID=185202 RepID=A0ACB9IPI4_9ASTR|nr:hypothetical protein L1987_19317 [Smallanthus sonchifolius]
MVVWHIRSPFEDFDPVLDYNVEVDMRTFMENVDMNEEWVGGGEQEEEHGEEGDDEAAHIDHDDFESAIG